MNLGGTHTHGPSSLRLLQVEAQQVAQHYQELLTPAEREYAHSAGDPRVRKARTVSRALLRSTLSRYLGGTAPGSLQFALNAHGKPSLAQPSGLGQQLQFNVTHTESIVGGWVAAAGMRVTDRRVHCLDIHL